MPVVESAMVARRSLSPLPCRVRTVMSTKFMLFQRSEFGPAQAGIAHQAQPGVVANPHRSLISNPYIQQRRDFGPAQGPLAATSAAHGIHPLHFGELEHAPPLFAIPFAILLGFLQPVQQADPMCFP